MKKIFAPLLLAVLLLVQCKKDDSVAAADKNLNLKAVGASANDFLSASKYTSIKIELQYMPGYAPDGAAITNLTKYLDTLLNKPGGISVVLSQIPASGKSVLSLTDITAIESANRTAFNTGNVLAINIIYADAAYSTANVLGVAFRNTSMVIFGPTVTSNSGGLNQTSRTKLESTVAEHEFGHLLGLTNLGTPMVTAHEDASHSGHCNNPNCLMYYVTQTTMMGGILLGNPVPVIDANCRADLRANGGK